MRPEEAQEYGILEIKEYAKEKWAVLRPPVPKEIEMDLAYYH